MTRTSLILGVNPRAPAGLRSAVLNTLRDPAVMARLCGTMHRSGMSPASTPSPRPSV